MKRGRIKTSVILILFLLNTSYGCLDNSEDTNQTSRLDEQNYFTEYKVQIKTKDNFTVVVPFLDIEYLYNHTSVSNEFLLSKLKANETNVSLSILDIKNQISDIHNFSVEEVVDFNGLRIEGSGNKTLSLKLYGFYVSYLTLRVTNNTDGNYLAFLNNSKVNQNLQISISANQYSNAITHWNEKQEYYTLKEGWNIIEIRGRGMFT